MPEFLISKFTTHGSDQITSKILALLLSFIINIYDKYVCEVEIETSYNSPK